MNRSSLLTVALLLLLTASLPAVAQVQAASTPRSALGSASANSTDPSTARSRIATEASVFSRAQSAALAGNFELAARLFSEVTDEAEKLRAEIELGHSLLALGLFDAATRQYDFVLRAGSNHPAYAEAVEGLIEINALTGEDVIVGALLDRDYGEGFARLPPALLDEVNAIVGTMSLRAGRLDEARAFFDAVAPTARQARRVDYLAGLVAARSGSNETALELFERALKPVGSVQQSTPPATTTFASQIALLAREAAHTRHAGRAIRISERELGELALLAKARTLYALGRFSESVLTFERIPRLSRFWEASLFENGWARLQNEDDGGALGTLQALHAPQFSGSFQPESWILKAIVYFTHCLHPEARAALASFESIYGPHKEALKALVAEPRSPEFWLEALGKEDAIPSPVLNELKANQRLEQLVGSLVRIEAEARQIRSLESWKGSKLQKAQLVALAQSQEVARRVAADFVEKRLRDALARLIGFDAQKEILELEIARVETEAMEARFDRSKQLQSQTLHRPKLGSEQQVYWPFQGEFWIDEIGYYRFTLKNGCQVNGEMP